MAKNINGFMNNKYRIKRKWEKENNVPMVILTNSENDMLYEFYLKHSLKEFERKLINLLNRKREEN